MDNILTGLFLLLITVLIIIFAYYTTTIIGKKTKDLMNGRYIQVLERTNIGLNTNITVVKVNKKIYVLALQAKTLKVVDIIDEEDWNYIERESKNYFDFNKETSNIFSKLFKK